ncbi:MAG: DUF4105 domain-containing protein, partial [Gammaproteobacteria bacterium]|nr:DUF4105 domain-containing protein [Gammaproteobacteria bacterium]
MQAKMSQEAYLAHLVTQAQTLKLSEDKEWLNLGHYKENLFSGYTSEIISQDFFYAKDGMTNPDAELKATLASFFSTLKETKEKQNPQCRHIARYHWLKDKLKFDSSILPEQTCKLFNDWYERIAPHRLT